MKSTLSPTNRLRAALVLGVAALPLIISAPSAQAKPPRYAPAYGYRAKHTTIVHRTYHYMPVFHRYHQQTVVTRTTRIHHDNRPTVTVRRTVQDNHRGDQDTRRTVVVHRTHR